MGDTFQELVNKQAHNQKHFRDIFEKIQKLMETDFPTEDQSQGVIKACLLIQNYILNREIDGNI